MILSMTGYGAAERVDDGIGYAVAIRSVNNRFLKLTVKLPDWLQFLEPDMEKLLRSRLGRGSVLYSLRIKRADDPGGAGFDTSMLQEYVDRMASIRMPDGVQATIDLAGLAQLLTLTEPRSFDDEQRQHTLRVVTELTERAIDGLEEMRRVEGRALRQDLHETCQAIRGLLNTVRDRAPLVVNEYHERLRSRVALLMSTGKFELEADALAREVAIYAERCDVNEEVSRLTSHLDQFEQICDRGEQAGRTLDFLSQELLREANTIASKSNDAEIARCVVEIKGRIDRLKEQVQNVE
jgi:uncharacterized protein (TIGR00255 family)